MQVGFTGKLPAYGDFLHGGGSLAACKKWSAWAETGLSTVRDVPGFHDIFLTSPIWRFVVSADVFSSAPVGGVFCPSMDKVGRLFPFAVMCELSPGISPPSAYTALSPWFEHLETLVLAALDPAATTDDLSYGLRDPEPLGTNASVTPLAADAGFSDLTVNAEGEPIFVESDPLDLSAEEPEPVDGIWITLGGADIAAAGVSQRGSVTPQLFSRLVTGGA